MGNAARERAFAEQKWSDRAPEYRDLLASIAHERPRGSGPESSGAERSGAKTANIERKP
jgi:hypothetical protein